MLLPAQGFPTSRRSSLEVSAAERFPSLRVELVPLNFLNRADIEQTVAAFVRSSNDAMIVTSGPLAAVHRAVIVATAARHKLPTVYVSRFTALDGGLISYGPDFRDQYRLAAGYVDRILKGEKPADLPVQAPTQYELVVNLKTAKALGLEVPPTLLARADSTSTPAAWSPTGPMSSTSFDARPNTLIVFSRARSRPTCQCRRRRSSSW